MPCKTSVTGQFNSSHMKKSGVLSWHIHYSYLKKVGFSLMSLEQYISLRRVNKWVKLTSGSQHDQRSMLSDHGDTDSVRSHIVTVPSLSAALTTSTLYWRPVLRCKPTGKITLIDSSEVIQLKDNVEHDTTRPISLICTQKSRSVRIIMKMIFKENAGS